MVSPPPILHKGRLATLVIIIILAIILDVVLNVPWEENVASVLNHYGIISHCFLVVVVVITIGRLLTVKSKGVAPESRILRLSIPAIDLSIQPLYDYSLFYSALFILHKTFQEHTQGFSLEPALILLIVAVAFLSYSIKDVFDMARQIVHVQESKTIVSR